MCTKEHKCLNFEDDDDDDEEEDRSMDMMEHRRGVGCSSGTPDQDEVVSQAGIDAFVRSLD